MAGEKDRIVYADDDREPIRQLAGLRLPPLIIGLLLGILLSFLTSRFEEVLAQQVEIAFFIPFVVYMAAAVGSQTQSIYVRDLKSGRANFLTYLFKESILGVILGFFCSLIVALVTILWFQSIELSLAVSLSMLTAISLAPVIALITVEFLKMEHSDPAVGSGPIATIIQDMISIVVYGLITSAVLL